MEILLIVLVTILIIFFFVFKDRFTDIQLTQEQQKYFNKYLQPLFDVITNVINNKDYKILIENVPGINNLELTSDQKHVEQIINKGDTSKLHQDFSKVIELIKGTIPVIDQLIIYASESGIYTKIRLQALRTYYLVMKNNNNLIINYFGK
jgi:hypothetical protein